jgi:hypothetical protein
MAPVVVAIVSLTVLGIPFVLALDRSASPLRLLGLAFLYGCGVIYFVLLALSVLGVRWTLVSVTIAALIAWSGSSFFVLRSSNNEPRTTNNEQRINTRLVDLVTLATLAGYTAFATIAPLWEWDFWAIWGLKARVFLEHGGIDWRFLASPWNTFAHPDYPLLVPFVYDVVALAGGGWDDRWLGLLMVAWAVAFLLVARDLAAREAPPLVAALVTLALSACAASRYVGLAEAALIAFMGAGVLFVRRALLFDDAAAWRHGALLLGLGACSKNEGLAMLASVAAALVLIDVRCWRRVLRLWPAAALALPWQLMRALHHLPTDVVSGSVVARLTARLSEARAIFLLLDASLYERWFWFALVAGIAVAPLAVWKRERFVLVASAIQIAVYAAAYFVTPFDPEWHIATSWPRLTSQVAAPLTYVVMINLANSLRRKEELPHAEARSEQP